MILESFLAHADDVIEKTFRNASFDGGEVSLWVNRVISGAGSDVRFTPKSDQIVASH